MWRSRSTYSGQLGILEVVGEPIFPGSDWEREVWVVSQTKLRFKIESFENIWT
jgi:hypothetical protein